MLGYTRGRCRTRPVAVRGLRRLVSIAVQDRSLGQIVSRVDIIRLASHDPSNAPPWDLWVQYAQGDLPFPLRSSCFPFPL
jgi:hypothetical protein